MRDKLLILLMFIALPFFSLALRTRGVAADASPAPAPGAKEPLCISGVYPHLAVFNNSGECGIGTVVPWADRLWAVTYPPHETHGSNDKLYEIDASLKMIVRTESVGGTHADRMIHRESNQLIIGPYFIDDKRNVRVISPKQMPGRLTAVARHLTDPANKVYFYTMEGTTFEVDVHSLEVKTLYERPVPGWHGKGAYSSQGRLVVANNGESHVGGVQSHYVAGADHKNPEDAGVLAQFNGKQWSLVARRQFAEITGPQGIAPTAGDTPLWAVGWDRRSLILKLLDAGQWHTFLLPKADHSYDPSHGWNTEWPRIREVAPGKLLMNMHGGWFEFPTTFSAAQTGGIRPLGTYLKITGDFCGWQNRIVFGCDHASKTGFHATTALDPLNWMIGQSNSNFWFTTWDGLSEAGRPSGDGGPWLRDAVRGKQPSNPLLVAGYAQRVLHLAHESQQSVTFRVELDADGSGRWQPYRSIVVPPHGYAYDVLPKKLAATWIRFSIDKDAGDVTAFFHGGPGGGMVEDRKLFSALADIKDNSPWCAGIGRPEGDDLKTMALETAEVSTKGEAKVSRPRYWRVGESIQFEPLPAEDSAARFLSEHPVTKPPSIEIDDASVIVVSGKKRFRLPKSAAAYDRATPAGWPRALREVVTERSLLNVHGTLYMLPRPDAGGILQIKPICTHDKKIMDFFTWRGLLMLTGTRCDAKPDGHYFTADGKCGVWLGDIDDLWKLGKPRGHGGPWLRTDVRAGEASDPYLMTGYDVKHLELSHDAKQEIAFTLEVDFDNLAWHSLQTLHVSPGQTLKFTFPAGYSAHWLRVRADHNCRATCQLQYE